MDDPICTCFQVWGQTENYKIRLLKNLELCELRIKVTIWFWGIDEAQKVSVIRQQRTGDLSACLMLHSTHYLDTLNIRLRFKYSSFSCHVLRKSTLKYTDAENIFYIFFVSIFRSFIDSQVPQLPCVALVASGFGNLTINSTLFPLSRECIVFFDILIMTLDIKKCGTSKKIN